MNITTFEFNQLDNYIEAAVNQNVMVYDDVAKPDTLTRHVLNCALEVARDLYGATEIKTVWLDKSVVSNKNHWIADIYINYSTKLTFEIKFGDLLALFDQYGGSLAPKKKLLFLVKFDNDSVVLGSY